MSRRDGCGLRPLGLLLLGVVVCSFNPCLAFAPTQSGPSRTLARSEFTLDVDSERVTRFGLGALDNVPKRLLKLDAPIKVKGVTAFLKEAFDIPSSQLVLEAQWRHEEGEPFLLFRFSQAVKKRPVYGGDFIVVVDTDAAKVVDVSGTFIFNVKADLKATVKPSKAAKIALDAARVQFPHAAKNSVNNLKLVIIPAPGQDRLAYCTQSFIDDPQYPADLSICVGADGDADVLEFTNKLHSVGGTGRTLYSGNVDLVISPNARPKKGFKLDNSADLQGRAVMLTTDMQGGTKVRAVGEPVSSPTTTFGDNTVNNPASAGADAQYGMIMTYDYFKLVHGRKGIDNKNMKVYSRVHVGSKYENAFWTDACNCMSYGDGDTYFKPLMSLDVAAHEMMHGITQFTANLEYKQESGGLNEAVSDIFAMCVQNWANKDPIFSDFTIGDTISFSGLPLRWMNNPSLDNESPNCWDSNLKNLDVHYSSGPANRAFYLMAYGMNKDTTHGPGFPSYLDACKVFYRALTTRMTATTNYKGARDATIMAAQDMVSLGQLPAGSDNIVKAAWGLVGVDGTCDWTFATNV